MNKTIKKEVEVLIEIDNQEAWEELLQKDGLKVVDVYQEWSGPCQAVIGLFKSLKNELNDNMLTFATVCAEKVESLERYRGRSEPYFLFYGASTLIAIVKGADPPKLEETIRNMLKQEHEVYSGDATRVEIEDEYLKYIEAKKAAAAKKKAREIEIDQEFGVLIIQPDAVKANFADEIIQMISQNGFEIVDDKELTLDSDIATDIFASEMNDADIIQIITNITSGPSRCLLITKGAQGVLAALASLVGPTETATDDVNNNPETSSDEKAKSIRDKFGNGAPKSVVTFTENAELAEIYRGSLFPSFVPPRVITYKEEEVKEKNVDSEGVDQADVDQEDEDGSETESSEIPEYDGPPRAILMIRPTAALHYADDIRTALTSAGYEIQSERKKTFTDEEAREYFADLSSMSVFDDLIKETISGPTLLIIVTKLDVFKELKDFLGPESFSQATENSPQSLRALFSSLPDCEKPNDLTWLQATLTDSTLKSDLERFFPIESTLAALKPDSIPVREEMIDLIKAAGFKIAARKEYQLTVDDIKILYESCIEKPFFNQLIDYLTSGSTMFLVLQCQDAVQRWRKIMGCSDPEKAVDSYPDDIDPEKQCLRAVYGRTVIQNAVHGSSSIEHAQRCIKLLFGTFPNEDDELPGGDPLAEGEAKANDEEPAAPENIAEDGQVKKGTEGLEGGKVTDGAKATDGEEVAEGANLAESAETPITGSASEVAHNEHDSKEVTESKAVTEDANVAPNSAEPESIVSTEASPNAKEEKPTNEKLVSKDAASSEQQEVTNEAQADTFKIAPKKPEDGVDPSGKTK